MNMKQRIRQPTRLVALDTEVFDRANFNYKSTSFKKLIELVKENKICLYITKITHQEIIDHISQAAQQAALAFKNLHKEFRKQAKIIHSSVKFNNLLYSSINSEDLFNELKEQFDIFLEETEIEILTLDNLSVENIFSKYFKNLPPFNAGKKKHEFPDAFAIAAIEAKAKVENKKIYIISGDKDWLEACNHIDNLIYTADIDKFLADIINQEYQEIDVCYKIFDDNLNTIKEQIEDDFVQKEFTLDDDFSYCVDFGSEEIDIDVDKIEIIDRYIVSIDDSEVEYPLLIFELKADISYTAHISYDSTEYAFWDSEDEIYYNLERIKGKVQQKISMSIEVEILLFRDESYNLCLNAVEYVDLDPNGSIGTIMLTPEKFEYIPDDFDSCFPT